MIIAPTGLLRGALDPPITDQASDIDTVWNVYLWLCFGVVALVSGLVAVIIIRFRRRSDEMPPQKHYNIPMEVAYTLIPLVVVLALFGGTLAIQQRIDEVSAADGNGGFDDVDLTIEVVAFQWQWQFTYPDADVTVTGGADTDIPTLVLPADSRVRFELESLDVIHSFWITAFRFKRDIIPGRPGVFEVDVNGAVGEYPNAGVCAEYCGLDHARMQFSVTVLERAEFEQWLQDRAGEQLQDQDQDQDQDREQEPAG